MQAALDHGLVVSKPWGDSAAYDFIVDDKRGHVFRVQVRSTAKPNQGCFQGHTECLAGRFRLTSDDADFLAVFVNPFRTWYIVPIPPRGLPSRIHLYPHRRSRRQKYERFREAWHLLTQTNVA